MAICFPNSTYALLSWAAIQTRGHCLPLSTTVVYQYAKGSLLCIEKRLLYRRLSARQRSAILFPWMSEAGCGRHPRPWAACFRSCPERSHRILWCTPSSASTTGFCKHSSKHFQYSVLRLRWSPWRMYQASRQAFLHSSYAHLSFLAVSPQTPIFLARQPGIWTLASACPLYSHSSFWARLLMSKAWQAGNNFCSWKRCEWVALSYSSARPHRWTPSRAPRRSQDTVSESTGRHIHLLVIKWNRGAPTRTKESSLRTHQSHQCHLPKTLI